MKSRKKSPAPHQALPTDWHEREKLRSKGQFWTPEWVARAMAAFIVGENRSEVFDPAVGEGVFLRQALELGRSTGRQIAASGTDIDESLLAIANRTLADLGTPQLEKRDFVIDPPRRLFPGIVANPPYVRHHRLDAEYKARLRALSVKTIGEPLDGRAGLQVYFLMRALTLLAPGGRLAFIIPADVFEGVSAHRFWSWVCGHFCLRAVVTFADEATPFPGVDTNAVVVFLEASKPEKTYVWARCTKAHVDDFEQWVIRGISAKSLRSVSAKRRNESDWLARGLHREDAITARYTLGDLATVRRGIATGANEFFLLTDTDVTRLGIDRRFLKKAVSRTRDVATDIFTAADWDHLRESGERVWLLDIPTSTQNELPAAIQRYLQNGHDAGLPDRALIAARTPWYKMEQRLPPPFLFAYLGRRNARFIRNEAGVVPLTGFLCVYPKSGAPAFLSALWDLLNAADLHARLRSVGKTYGGGAVKVEPRSLEALPLSDTLPPELTQAADEPVQSVLHLKQSRRPRKDGRSPRDSKVAARRAKE